MLWADRADPVAPVNWRFTKWGSLVARAVLRRASEVDGGFALGICFGVGAALPGSAAGRTERSGGGGGGGAGSKLGGAGGKEEALGAGPCGNAMSPRVLDRTLAGTGGTGAFGLGSSGPHCAREGFAMMAGQQVRTTRGGFLVRDRPRERTTGSTTLCC